MTPSVRRIGAVCATLPGVKRSTYVLLVLLALGASAGADAKTFPVNNPGNPGSLSPAGAARSMSAKLATRPGEPFSRRNGGLAQPLCPRVEIFSGHAQCVAQWRDGRATWWFALGTVTGGQISNTNPSSEATIYELGHWTRRWVSCPLHGSPGTLTSNNDCGRQIPESDAYFVQAELLGSIRSHRSVAVIGWQFTDSAGYSILGDYRISRHRGTYVATNGVGDSFRYTP